MMYDLIVIGGGPAGSAAARNAALNGLKVCIIEKQSFPRYKPCGGAVSDRALTYLGLDLHPKLIENEVYGARVFFRGKKMERLRDYRIAILTTRSVFDEFLLNEAGEAGAEVVCPDRIIDIVETQEGVVARSKKRTYRAKYGVIAEGSNGKLQSKVRRRDSRAEYGICVVAEIPADQEAIKRRISQMIEIHFGVGRFGYGWLFPHNEYLSVGVGGVAKYMRDARRVMSRFLYDQGFSGDYKVHGGTIPAGGIRRRVNSSRLILVGDAAGFVDPFYGEGIAYAIRSGQLAAETVAECLAWGGERISSYEKRCRKEFADNLRFALLLSKLMYLMPGLFIRIMTTYPDAMDNFLDVAGNRISYRRYLAWIIMNLPRLIIY